MLVIGGLFFAVVAASVAGYVWWRWQQVDRIALADVLSGPTPAGENWLLVGTDSRAGLDPERDDAAALMGETVTGQRADALVLVRRDGNGTHLLSLPRDLWLDPPGPNNAARINGLIASHPAALITAIQDQLGVPVHHYVEIDLAGLDRVVDAIGGVRIEVPHPAFDPKSGLNVPVAGVVWFDGASALAYVRSRTYTEVIDGVERLDPTADLGRTARQQVFLQSLASELSATRNPLALNAAVRGVVASIRLDDSTGIRDAYNFARTLKNATPTDPLPVTPTVTDGGASVLVLGADADSALAPYRG